MFNITGLFLALVGAAIAFIFPALVSGKGARVVAEAANGVLVEDPKRFGACLLLQAITATQAIYGFIISFIILMRIGIIGGNPLDLSVTTGVYFLFAALPVCVVASLTGLSQARAALAGISLVAKRPEEVGKSAMHAAMIETNQILGLLISFLICLGIPV